jgi:Rad3-related DNA helicase
MTNELHQLLDHIGYKARPQQEKLFDLLSGVSTTGVIAQAGTGTGKSIAVLAAAARAFHTTGIQSLVVTPTRILMDQYMASDAPAAAECFGLDIAELRGRRWYDCDISADLVGGDSDGPSGCMGRDVDCSIKAWMGLEDDPDVNWHLVEPHEFTPQYRCGYQEAKYYAGRANIVVTNTDFWVINDRTLPDPIFSLYGAVFVDESHQLEAKLKDYAGRSVREKELRTHYGDAGHVMSKMLERYRDGKSDKISPGIAAQVKVLLERGPDKRDNGTIPERAQEVQEALEKIYFRITDESENVIIWSDGWSLKMDWIDISASARSLLTARPFGLVSATIPSSMPSALGVSDAVVADVGHPFDYGKQATLSISEVDGSFRYAGSKANFQARVNELKAKIEATKGGCLLLFSSFADMKRVYDEIAGEMMLNGRTVLLQNDQLNVRTNDEIAAIFKEDGKAVLFGSESFATGFDVPGDALELVSVWKLPYPGKDPVTEATMKRFYQRYKDLMLTRIVQAAGRLIRTESDRGHLHICDSRAEDIVKSKDLMVRHLGEFARV